MENSVNKCTKAHKRSNANKNEGFSVVLCEINLRDPKTSGKELLIYCSFLLPKMEIKAGLVAQKCYKSERVYQISKGVAWPSNETFCSSRLTNFVQTA